MEEFKLSLKDRTEEEWLAIVKGITLECEEVIKDLISLNLWSARRLKHQQYKDFAYDELDGITNEKHERV
jgi:hypothetical protein